MSSDTGQTVCVWGCESRRYVSWFRHRLASNEEGFLRGDDGLRGEASVLVDVEDSVDLE